MTTKQIKLEFVRQPGYTTLTPRTDGRWGSFQNTYAVWTSSQSVVETITITRKIELQQGYYFVTGTVDNSGSVTVNGTVINLFVFNTNISRTDLRTSTRIYHSGGLMDIVIVARNQGDVAGVAVTISKAIQLTGFQTGSGTYVIDDLVWSTRTPGVTTIGRYVFTMPYAASITAHVFGGGGSGAAGMGVGSNWLGGSTFYSPPGGRGSPGLYNTQTFAVAAGDEVEVFVGSAGVPGTVLGGAPHDGGNAPGGAGGASRTSVGGVAAQSYNGGRGGQGGRAVGWSYGGIGQYGFDPRGGGTGGGGGGGASGVLVNDLPAIVAGGGGGGGGSGIVPDGYTNGSQGGGDSNAAITKNAIGTAPGDNRGENGKDVGPTDIGGGGGGGGGGYPGGQGGMSRGSADSLGFHYGYRPLGGTGFHGKCGGNYPAYPASTGAGTLYYDARYGQGGAGGLGSSIIGTTGGGSSGAPFRGASAPVFSDPGPGQSGTDGRVVLIMEPIGLSSVKVGGEWRQITEVFYKVGGVYKDISDIFIKINDEWKPIEGGGGATPNISQNPGDYGLNNRNYS